MEQSVLMSAASLVVLIIMALGLMLIYKSRPGYTLGPAGSLLSAVNQPMADKLKYQPKQKTFEFNDGYSVQTAGALDMSGPQITASANLHAAKGITVTDPVNQIALTVTPKMGLLAGKQSGNRIIYPLADDTGWVVYTMHSIGVKEDVVLTKSSRDQATFDYDLGLGNSLSAKVEPDGSVGVYGNAILSGNVSTGTSQDAALLQKARQNAPKDTLLFSIPAPTVKELGQAKSNVLAKYALHGDTLEVQVSGLNRAHYPLTIDPSIYVETAQKFMNGNNETNIDFDVADTLIQKGKTTGARFNSWNSTKSLNSSAWQEGVAVAGGYIYTVGGVPNGSTVSWAKFNTSTGTIDNADPGTGTCSGWCTSTSYNLPAPRSSLTLVAYNGFLYAIGGEDSSCTTGNGTGDGGVCKTVYITRLGANGEPQLWSPTSTNQATWTYWYRDTDLSTPRSFTAAVAYNNRLYLLGGKTSSGGTPSVTNTVQTADIIPTGQLSNWATSAASLPYNVYGHGAQVYNDRLYVIGGDSSIGGTPLSSVYYNKINSDGTLNSWVATSSFSGGRLTEGGNFTTVWGGYIYLSGGCGAVNASGYCTSVDSDTQMASINADGSLDTWDTNASVSDTRMGHNVVAWRSYVYEVGGCSVQNTTTGACSSMLNTINYGTINQDGDASTVAQSVPSGTAPCSGTTPTGCNLPGTTYVGNMLAGAVITNGYLYVIGGCTNNTCSTTIGNVAYTAISSTGSMVEPATCPVGAYQGGAWCVDTTDTIGGGIAATSPVVFGGRIYLVGGLNGNSNTNTIDYTTVNRDGSISAWTSQSMTGVGANSVSYLYAYARANPASAGTIPGNLYIFGGCGTSSAAGCTAYSQNVYKCNIGTSGAIAACSTTNQQQIGVVPGDYQTGLGIMSGTVYANYIYLIGGVSPNQTDLKTLRYAKFDNNNNVVSANGSGAWVESPNQMSIGRRRAAAFGYNGYIYVVGGYDGTGGGGVLADIEFIKVNVSDGSLGSSTDSFHVSAVTINQRWGLSVPISNSYAYVIGGCTTGASPGNCTARTDVVQTFQVYNNDSGAPAGYTASSGNFASAPDRIGLSATVLNGYLYAAGGCIDTICASVTSDVERAILNADGTLGTWSNAGSSLPAGRSFGKLETAGGSLYYIGGRGATTCTPTGNSLFEKWNNVSGTAVSSLYSDPSYPNSPDIIQTLNDGKLETATNIDDNYGAKLEAIICPSTTGAYSFWVASDDNSELRLSTDSNPANVAAIASVPGYTNQYEWTKYPSQHSANVTLTAGTPYYIEVNYKEGGGGDHAEIGWTLPSGTQQLPIPGSAYYSPTEAPGTPSANVYYASGASGYLYRQAVALNHTQVSGSANLSSFPVQVSLTESALKTVANGGNVQNSNGYDILFTASDGTTALPYEVEHYNGATGQLVAWVNVPTLSYSADTQIYMYYDNSNISTFQGNVAGTWNSNYNSVLHLPDGSTLSTADSTSNGLSGTNNGATATTGKMDGAASLNGTSQYISVPSATLPSSGNFTTSLWFKTTSNGVLLSEQNNVIGSAPSSRDPMLYVDSTGKLHGGIYGGSVPNLVSSGTVNNGVWHNVVLVVNHTGSSQTLYLDGALVGSAAISPEGPFSYVTIGAGYDSGWPNAPAATTSYFNGQIDEFRVLNTASLTAGWITTAYNSGNAPGNFQTAGSPQAYGSYSNWYQGAGGALGLWSTASNGLPQARANFGAAVWNNRLYVVGGDNASSSPQNTVYVSPQLNAGGDISSAWSTTSTSFNVARSGLTAIAYANNLYVLGGYDGTNYLSDVQYAQISSSSGNAGSWSYTTSLPDPLSDADGFAVNGYMYLIGGRSSATSCRPLTLVAPISANTAISSGNNPTGIGEWYETNQKYNGDRYGAAAVYNDGKAYVLGGGCSASFVGSSDRAYSTTLLSQPQVAKYSIMFDTDTDVYPQKWLLNGLDNSIGANWQLSYRSMTNTTTFCSSPAMTTWGQAINVGNVTLGTPGVYTPVDGSGVNVNCGRFFYLSVYIDSSHAYGYPEDVSRGPTITDLTLEFTADPAKRLMHGRTFTGGLQQPDATPF